MAGVGEDDHAGWVLWVAPRDEEAGHVFDVLLASLEFIFAASVIDADQEGFTAHHGDGCDGCRDVQVESRRCIVEERRRH